MLLCATAAVVSCREEVAFPANPGYLRASSPRVSNLTIFDAETFGIYRSVGLPRAIVADSHRLEFDPTGRIWMGSSQAGISALLKRENRVLVFSPRGDLEHELDLDCACPRSGIAFVNGYAFVGCAASGFYGRVVVVDTDTMSVVKTFDKVRPPDQGFADQYFYLKVVAEVAGKVLVIGQGNPPEGYQRVTPHSAPVAAVGVIYPVTLSFGGFQTDFEPEVRVLSVLEVDGKAWLFNELSHVQERPDRTDVYVLDPHTLRIVDAFNLEHLFPTWAVREDEETIYIFHRVGFTSLREAGYRSGITRLDLNTGKETFMPIPELPFVDDMDVYLDTPCLAHKQRSEGSGLWCVNDLGELELSIPQKEAVGILFGPSSP